MPLVGGLPACSLITPESSPVGVLKVPSSRSSRRWVPCTSLMSSSPISESGEIGVCVGRALLPLLQLFPHVTSRLPRSRLRLTTAGLLASLFSSLLLPTCPCPFWAAQVTPHPTVPSLTPSLGPWLLTLVSLVVSTTTYCPPQPLNGFPGPQPVPPPPSVIA